MPSNSWLAVFFSFYSHVDKAQATLELILLKKPPLQQLFPALNFFVSLICSKILILIIHLPFIFLSSSFRTGLGLRDFWLHTPFPYTRARPNSAIWLVPAILPRLFSPLDKELHYML